MDLNQAEFLRLTSTHPQPEREKAWKCSFTQGPHITLWSIICIPVAMIISLVTAFYNGALTWHNLTAYFGEEKSWFHKLTICPLLILSFPFSVGLSSLGVSVVAMVMQVSWGWHKWREEILDGEKGFYGWFCGKIGLSNCSPYQVVVFDDSVI